MDGGWIVAGLISGVYPLMPACQCDRIGGPVGWRPKSPGRTRSTELRHLAEDQSRSWLSSLEKPSQGSRLRTRPVWMGIYLGQRLWL